ncbi:MAG: response regulator [Hyphomicrobiaceae bacterium]|nr:response regulator [Hyphomicrobiaceae bacterium]
MHDGTTQASRPTRVLVVDDDPLFAPLASGCLAAAGYDTATAKDGANAYGMLERMDFDIALVDLSMPRVDGLRLLGMIRSHKRHRHLPVMVVTSRRDISAIEEAYRLGANSFQTKPVNWTLLPSLLRYILRDAATVARLRELARDNAA